jgi:phytoene dehydrogenase-like protein
MGGVRTGRALHATLHGRLNTERYRRRTRPSGKHTLSLFCQYAPYRLSEVTWEERRDEIGANIVETFAQYAPNLPNAIEQIEVLGPRDIEARIGITGGKSYELHPRSRTT